MRNAAYAAVRDTKAACSAAAQEETEEQQEDNIILCHAPLAAHNPKRSGGEAYLDRNTYLQNIMNRFENIIYISGHTHVSPNYAKPCAEYDAGILYLNDGSVAPTELKGSELYPAQWKDGVITELGISDHLIEITMKSAQSGTAYPRGYYRFGTEPILQEALLRTL